MVDAATATDLDARVAAFEAAWAVGPADPAEFLPPQNHVEYFAVLTELLRVDLEFRHGRGLAADLDGYRARFPALFAEKARIGDLAYEEYRLRADAGGQPQPAAYAKKFGIDTTDWPPPEDGTKVVAVSTTLAGEFPVPGDTVLDLHLTSELGRGSFGRVYLAEQMGLANRRVAVKLSTRFGAAEPETLARLQHTHIVPVYSTAVAGPFQVVVMPFLGATTFADVLVALRGRASWPASGKDLADTLANRRSRTRPDAAGGPALPPTPVGAEMLAKFSLPEAVLWVGAKLADALAHAHARGVLHRDVKPANVLLTDDGVPMLLDFNLADDAGRDGKSETGGTPGYMAPEQFGGGGGPAADIFSLGVVLFELLTGRHPYPNLGQQTATDAPYLLPLSAAVSPSTEAIIRRCIEPDAKRRYAAAADLVDDLERQLAHRPLAHTREPSARERFAKWRWRNPSLASAGSVAAAATLLLAVVGAVAFNRYQRAERLQNERAAATAFAEFSPAFAAAVDDLALHGTDPVRRRSGVMRMNKLLEKYGPPDAADWVARPPAAFLTDAERTALRSELAELLLLRARVEPDVTAALALNARATTAFGESAPLAAAWDRDRLLASQGRADAAERTRHGLPQTSGSAQDFYLEGLSRWQEGEFVKAVDSFGTAVRLDPKHYWAWQGLGSANGQLGQHLEAEGCFNACVALRPDLPMGFFNRGLCRLVRKKYSAADQDFTAVLELWPGRTAALADRALARLRLGRTADAIADLNAALDAGAPETRLFFLRADAKAAAGDAAGAAADRREGVARKPSDEASWVARGLHRARENDTAGALADFDAALELNPRSYPALQNKAFTLDGANLVTEALVVLDRAVLLFPDAFEPRAGRAVLLARRGNRDAAHADAEYCLKLAPPAITVYQLAGVYAQTSTGHPEDARTAFRLLSDALSLGAGFEHVDSDPDLNPLRPVPEFKAVVEAARAVVAKKTSKE